MALPPNHRPDHVPVCILSIDDAWDVDRITYELGVLRGEKADEARPALPCERVEDHPYRRYLSGEARGDVSTVEQYLTGEPVRFVLRRLGLMEWATVEDLLVNSPSRALIWALRHALVRIDGHELELKRGGSDAGAMTTADAEAVRALTGDKGFTELCSMAINVSRHLSEAEKKA